MRNEEPTERKAAARLSVSRDQGRLHDAMIQAYVLRQATPASELLAWPILHASVQ